MSWKLSVAVMAHPKRERFVPDLVAALDREPQVVWDRHNDRWDTGRRSMLAFGADATHHLVIQDDTIPCRDLVAGVEKALAALPDPEHSPLSLYCGRVRPYRDLINRLVASTTAETSWLTMSQLHWGPGIVLPTHLIPDMLAYCDERTEIPNYDRRISTWCQHGGLTVWYSWPSLVEHRGVRENPSLIPGRDSDRRAHRFLGEDVSALDQSWSGDVVNLAGVSRYSPVVPPHRHSTAAAVPRPPKPKRLGVKVDFISPKYPQLQVPAARVRFRDGEASTSNPEAIAALLHPKVAALGVQPVGEVPDVTVTVTADKDFPGAEVPELAPNSEPTPVADDVPKEDGEPESENRDGDPVPEPEPPADESAVPTSGAKEVLTWVAEDPDRAQQALEVEQARDKPRSTLVAALTKLAS